MNSTTYAGGLSGKARRARLRSRVSRLHAQQLIEGYFEPEDAPSYLRFSRPIRMGRRAEFLPSVDGGDAGAGAGAHQLVINFDDRTSTATTSDAPMRPDAGPPMRHGSTQAHRTGSIRSGRTWLLQRRFAGPASDAAVRGFSLRRFLCGCAVGAAVAAAILLAVQAALL